MPLFSQHVESLLQEVLGVEDIEIDEDGDWPIHTDGGLLVYVRAEPDPSPHVQVFARVATGVDASAWRQINELNVAAMWGKVTWWEGGDVMVERRLLPDGLNTDVIEHAIHVIRTYVSTFGPVLGSTETNPPQGPLRRTKPAEG